MYRWLGRIKLARCHHPLVYSHYSYPLRRQFHASLPARVINPLLPFDILEDVQNDDLEEANKKLKKEKKKLIKQKRHVEKDLEDDEENGNKLNGKKSKSDDKKSNDKKSDESDEKEPGRNYESDKKNADKEYKTVNDTVPLNMAVSKKVSQIAVEKDKASDSSNESNEVKKETKDSSEKSEGPEKAGDAERPQTDGSSPPGGNGNGNGNGPPEDESREEKKERKRKEKEEEEELEEEEVEDETESPKHRFRNMMRSFGKFCLKCIETIGITFSSLAILGVAGIMYHRMYNVHVLDKIDRAFDDGDPAYQLSMHKLTAKKAEGKEDPNLMKYWVERPQQKLLDDIIRGDIVGRYFLVIGEKGTGKTSLLLEAMKKVDGYNVAMFDAHADPEIFRIRLGKALNFAYAEDYIGSLFSIRGPRDTTALLDIERAFGKLEEVALRRASRKEGRPLILIINNAHLVKENEEGIKLVELLQQKAESLSGSGLVTMIFNLDDYWVYEKLKKLGTRLELINVRDLSRQETVKALHYSRETHFPSNKFPHLKLNDELNNQIYDLIGGRPQHVSQVARHEDILRACHEIIDREKTWFLNQCGLLGQEMDDDVMESGKFSTSAMMLMREFVEMDRRRLNSLLAKDIPDPKDEKKDHQLPELPLWRARQIMTRADYIQQYDNLNIFTIDSESRVRADSVPMMRAFHEIASQPRFDELLDETIERVAAIESLGRTREIVAKDLALGGKYKIRPKHDKWVVTMEGEQETGEKDDDIYMEEITRHEGKKWWKKRMQRFHESYLPATKDNFDIDINRR